ncbi:MFS transporter [Nocardia sp. BMG51109]|uniref:MFS transporter n=1 Tax=Nocardia sp. BMG51109 TaxID=1056816 RepID=UPI0004B4D0EB|nr:MFS transporter [Nocardia sp. BMG51109]
MGQVWPRWVAGRRDRRRLALCGVAVLSSLPGVDAAVQVAAVPQARQTFESAGWICAIGYLVTVACLPAAGALGDRAGRRRMLVIGGLGVAIGCLTTAVADGVVMFAVGRAVTGVAVAAVAVTALAVLPGLFFRAELPAVVGMWLAVQSAAVLAGGVFGAALATGTGWRVGNLLTVVLAVAAVLIGCVVVPDTEAARDRRFDGIGVSAAGVVAAVLCGVISGAGEFGRLDRSLLDAVPIAAVAAVGCLVVLVAALLIRRACRRPDSVLPVRVFRATPFTAGCSAAVAGDLAVAAYTLPVARLLGGEPTEHTVVALILAVPMSLGMVIGSVASGSAQERGVPLRVVLVSGLLCTGLGVLLGALVDVRADAWLYATVGTVVGFGAAWTRNAQTSVVVGSVEPERAGSAAAVTVAAGRLGGVLGPAVLVPVTAATGAAAFYDGFATGLRVVVLVLCAVAVAIGVLLYGQRARTTVEAMAYGRYRAGQGHRAGNRSAAVRFAS